MSVSFEFYNYRFSLKYKSSLFYKNIKKIAYFPVPYKRHQHPAIQFTIVLTLPGGYLLWLK